MASHLGLCRGHLRDRRAHATELGGHGEAEVPALTKDDECLVDEGAVTVVVGAELRKLAAQLPCERDESVRDPSRRCPFQRFEQQPLRFPFPVPAVNL